jgi:hypothetical protein
MAYVQREHLGPAAARFTGGDEAGYFESLQGAYPGVCDKLDSRYVSSQVAPVSSHMLRTAKKVR